jgi:hypothetical protein
MKYSDQNIYPEGFDASRVGELLDSAALAAEGGNSRLAIHLYCAAFEASQENAEGVDQRTLKGLRQAWTLACEQGDRATAETIFNDLIPYNSDEQTQTALAELQEMAMGQLGLKKSEMESMALALADEIRDAGIDIDALADRFTGAHSLPAKPFDLDMLSALMADDLPENLLGEMMGNLAENQPGEGTRDSIEGAPASGAGAGVLSVPKERAGELPDVLANELAAEGLHPHMRYANLAGFRRVEEKMRAFGLIDPSETELHDFFRQAESFHGVSGPVLTRNFMFVGSSREDCGVFAQATANEIGWPVITMIVDANSNGDGTIKVMAPVRRSFFGQPRVADLPNPCTLVIQNVDILQNLFWGEEQAINKGNGPYGFRHTEEHPRLFDPNRPGGMPPGMSPGMPPAQRACQRHSLQNEIMGYLGALFARGGVFVIATSAASSNEMPLVLSEQLDTLLGKPIEIDIGEPDLQERREVLDAFSDEHPSFHDLDKRRLARLSEGMSRFDIIVSCHRAVELAYSESLKNQRHQMVDFKDVLTHFARYLPQDSAAYRLVEDYLVAVFTEDIETELCQAEIEHKLQGVDGIDSYDSHDGF